MSEHEVHEIQLNGKQLVFMFMAATVVSVVIFLCGVMVGRGVPQPDADVLAANTGIPIDPTVSFDDASPGPAPAADTAPAPAPAPEEESLTYAERLEAPVPLNEPLKPAPAKKPAVAPAVAEKPAPPPERAANTSFAEPPGKGYVIQVMAYPTLAEAEALARRLDGKGYQMFVTVNDDAPRARYRVRVGKFASKRERDAVAARLQKEERFKPWLIP